MSSFGSEGQVSGRPAMDTVSTSGRTIHNGFGDLDDLFLKWVATKFREGQRHWEGLSYTQTVFLMTRCIIDPFRYEKGSGLLCL